MPLDFSRARPLLQGCDFKKLFVEELGWESCRQSLTLRAGEQNFTLAAFAEKRGFVGWLCESNDSALPDHTTRLKLDRALAQTSFEHLVVFVTRDRSRQSWMWVRREPGRPLRGRTHEYTRGQPGDSLLQKLQLLFVSLEEEEAGLSIAEIAGRVRAAFDIERVTKQFYRDFDTHRKTFVKFIEGIGELGDREWYASVMLNRLMFAYFIQRKGFLDRDPHYLRNRLRRMQAEHGKDKFYSFYRYFLLRLFHEGLGGKKRPADLEKLVGRIPYLNGGMFDIHELEKPERYGKTIQIPDKAFERIFDYFDQYQWHLDERPLRADNEINPDVLGYIFEKYINQKQMGAYYTKEDITEYISKNTVIPFLFDAAKKACRVAFEGSSSRREEAHSSQATQESQSLVTSAATPTVWDLLRENPNRYIYPAVRHGTDKPLPSDIEAGVKDVSMRTGWNKAAPGEYALPTEIWREVVARRTRYFELRARLTGQPLTPALSPSDGERENRSQSHDKSSASSSTSPADVSPSPGGEGRGEGGSGSPLPSDGRGVRGEGIRDINDLITLNLDIRQFAQDVIENCEGPELLRAFWHAIEKLTALDLTCGSGAFLFAALNILEPLYEACLDRMEAMLEDEAAKHDRTKLKFTERGYPLLPHKKFEDFSLLLDRVAAHPNRRYFIFKSIILKNLFGVDIMEEAVEICKLRLFLKLAAQVEPDAAKENLGIEPLPDIDFNIRAGNTLVGYATADEVRRCMTQFGDGQMRLGVEDELNSYARFAEKVELADRAFRQFREMQTERGMDAKDFVDAKRTLRERLNTLEDDVNRYLATDCGVTVSDKATYAKWLKTHRPFHWFVEFYGIVSSGGFDVIIGNPPYLEYSKVTDYTIRNYATEESANLYVFTVERSFALNSAAGRAGMIIPISVACSGAMDALRNHLSQTSRSLWLSHFSNRPGQLFTGAQNRLTIFLASGRKSAPSRFSTRYHRWDAKNGERDSLLLTLRYQALAADDSMFHGLLPKVGCSEAAALGKIKSTKTIAFFTSRHGRQKVYWVRVPGYFCQFLLEPPMARPENGGPARVRGEVNDISFDDRLVCHVVHAVLNSSTYYLNDIKYRLGRDPENEEE